VGLFGFQFACDILPGEMTPAREEDYDLQNGLCREVLASIKADEKLLLVGPTGVGKSSLIEQLAARLNWPVVRVAASGGLTEEDLLGEWTVRDGETVFNYGFLPRAMRMGAICLIDEIDGLEPSVAFSIHQLMEDRGRLVLLQNGGEIIEPHPRFRLVCTANSLVHGDETGLYTGTRVLNAAFMDRFACVMRVGHLPPQREVEVILSKAPDFPAELAEKLVNVAGGVRQARENDEGAFRFAEAPAECDRILPRCERPVYCTCSTRRLIDVAREQVQLGDLGAALRLALLSRLSDPDRRVVEEIVQRHLGEVG
jgi:cobaltochelatase CobS